MKLETTQYLLDYGWILLWYCNFDAPINSLDYHAYFTAMMEYVLNKSPEKFPSQYKQIGLRHIIVEVLLVFFSEIIQEQLAISIK